MEKNEENIENKKVETKKATTKKTTTSKTTAKKGTSQTATKRSTTKNNINTAKKSTTAKAITKTANKTTKSATKTEKKDIEKIDKSKGVKTSKKKDERVKQIISEQLTRINNIEEIAKSEEQEPKAKEKKEKKINTEEIAKKIENAKKMPKKSKKEMFLKAGINILSGLSVILYFVFINIGRNHISPEIYVTDLKVFNLMLIALTVILFEQAYNKDSGKLALFGVEFLIISIVTLVSLYIYILHEETFQIYSIICAATAITYYLVKSIVVCIKERKKWLNGISDVKEIVLEEDK